MTGGRLKRLSKYLGNETFFMTYGDGLSNVNISQLVKFHKKKKKFDDSYSCETARKVWCN